MFTINSKEHEHKVYYNKLCWILLCCFEVGTGFFRGILYVPSITIDNLLNYEKDKVLKYMLCKRARYVTFRKRVTNLSRKRRQLLLLSNSHKWFLK